MGTKRQKVSQADYLPTPPPLFSFETVLLHFLRHHPPATAASASALALSRSPAYLSDAPWRHHYSSFVRSFGISLMTATTTTFALLSPAAAHVVVYLIDVSNPIAPSFLLSSSRCAKCIIRAEIAALHARDGHFRQRLREIPKGRQDAAAMRVSIKKAADAAGHLFVKRG